MNLPLSGDNGFYIDFYARYRRDPASVPADWRVHFETLDGVPVADPELGGEWLAMAYRQDGHSIAQLDPLGQRTDATSPRIAAARQRAGSGQLRLTLGGESVTLPAEAAAARLAALYCGSASLQAGHLDDEDHRRWLWQYWERALAAPADEETLTRSLTAILLADAFERTVRTKWPTKKRFGSEGSESSLVLLCEALEAAATTGCREVVIGGMHRGRLASLATVFGKSLPALIAEIKGRDVTVGDSDFTGDVPYHNGLRSQQMIAGQEIDIRVLPHPSHLTVVAPVAMGAARARRQRRSDGDVLALMLHTDAAFAGQGLVSEILQLDGLEGYGTGGTIHLIVNNQIGFTTMPEEGRSTLHPTDIARAYGLPVFHVNGEDPVAAAAVMRAAIAWRQHSGRGALINMVCYRRYGHNELDEPRFTQPAMWAQIDRQPPLASHFAERIGRLSPPALTRASAARDAFQAELDEAFRNQEGRNAQDEGDQTITFGLSRNPLLTSGAAQTGLDVARLRDLANRITGIPDDFDPDPKVANFYRLRRESLISGEGINMATAESLAFASLLAEGVPVRLSGQDVVRGTFTQRHLAVHDRASARRHMPLDAACRQGARFEAVNSPLTEYAVLSFEYGASLADPDRLIIWEAQFGDFLNGAQIVVDQFITTAEAKWRLPSGLVIALPHGLEGQGPDHSSARIERLLQSCANRNIRLANPTTPANLFHLLRQQILVAERKPLFLIAPKSLLRDKTAASPLADFSTGSTFRPVIVGGTENADRLILCSGKFAYAIEAARREADCRTVAIARLEQLYPCPETELQSLLAQHPAAELVWVQEEPQNQGAWSWIRDRLHDLAPARPLRFIGRSAMAAAAGGNIERHEQEQAEILARAIEQRSK